MAGAKHLVRHTHQIRPLSAGFGARGRRDLEDELPRVGPSALDRGGAIGGGRRVAGRARDACLGGTGTLDTEGPGSLSPALPERKPVVCYREKVRGLLASPAEGYRAIHRVLHGTAGLVR